MLGGIGCYANQFTITEEKQEILTSEKPVLMNVLQFYHKKLLND